MSAYRFTCGQHVTFTIKRLLGPGWTGDYVITRLLPSGGEEPRYEIKSLGERWSRAAFESELNVESKVLETAGL